jgi:hypothetical protein
MLAHWVVLLGRYCLAVGRWLQQWHHEQQQKLQQLLIISRGNGISSALSSSEVSGLLSFTCQGATSDAMEVLQSARWLLGCPSLQQVGALWETCSTDAESKEDHDAYSSFSSGSGFNGEGMGPEYARAWQQWQADAGQQQVPAYGSLATQFAGLNGMCTDQFGYCVSLILKTRERVRKLERAGTGASASSSSSTADDAGVNGYEGDAMLRECCVAEDAVGRAMSAAGAVRVCLGFSGFAALGAELQEVGGGVCGKLPLSWLCNNPLCTSMGGASELQLVGGSSCVCGGCRVAR